MRTTALGIARKIGALALCLALAACDRPTVEPIQGGYRGTGMAQIYNVETILSQAALNAEPVVAPAARIRENVPKAGEV